MLIDRQAKKKQRKMRGKKQRQKKGNKNKSFARQFWRFHTAGKPETARICSVLARQRLVDGQKPGRLALPHRGFAGARSIKGLPGPAVAAPQQQRHTCATLTAPTQGVSMAPERPSVPSYSGSTADRMDRVPTIGHVATHGRKVDWRSAKVARPRHS